MTHPRIDAALPVSDGVLFSNADWRVSGDGLEHRATGYFVARETLAMRHDDGLWAWPLRLAEKSWCTPRLFREAFLAAVEGFGLARDAALARSFAIGFGLRPDPGGRDGFVALADLVRPKDPRARVAAEHGAGYDRRRAGAGRRQTAGASA